MLANIAVTILRMNMFAVFAESLDNLQHSKQLLLENWNSAVNT
jgi:hypothetical protein